MAFILYAVDQQRHGWFVGFRLVFAFEERKIENIIVANRELRSLRITGLYRNSVQKDGLALPEGCEEGTTKLEDHLTKEARKEGERKNWGYRVFKLGK